MLYQETLQTVQQLESNLSNLRKWLAQMEHKLSTPIRYKHPDMAEIQKKLEEQKEIQKDIERHSAGITVTKREFNYWPVGWFLTKFFFQSRDGVHLRDLTLFLYVAGDIVLRNLC